MGKKKSDPMFSNKSKVVCVGRCFFIFYLRISECAFKGTRCVMWHYCTYTTSLSDVSWLETLENVMLSCIRCVHYQRNTPQSSETLLPHSTATSSLIYTIWSLLLRAYWELVSDLPMHMCRDGILYKTHYIGLSKRDVQKLADVDVGWCCWLMLAHQT